MNDLSLLTKALLEKGIDYQVTFQTKDKLQTEVTLLNLSNNKIICSYLASDFENALVGAVALTVSRSRINNGLTLL